MDDANNINKFYTDYWNYYLNVEKIQPGLLDKNSMSDIYVDNSFTDKYIDATNSSDISTIQMPKYEPLINTDENNYSKKDANKKPDFYKDIYEKTISDLKKNDPNFLNPANEIGSINPEKVSNNVGQFEPGYQIGKDNDKTKREWDKSKQMLLVSLIVIFLAITSFGIYIYKR